MSFTTPTFNLLCDIYTGPWSGKSLRQADVTCNLAFGKRVNGFSEALDPFPLGNGTNARVTLLLPAGTDVRSFPLNPVSDMVEVPKGTGRWYIVAFVDDIGKGFANEHRCAVLGQASQTVNATQFAGLVWPIPMP